MIENFNLLHRHRKVKDKLKVLGAKKMEIQKQLSALGLSDNKKAKLISPSYNGVDDRSKLVRQNLLDELNKIEEQIKPLSEERMKLHREKESSKNLALIDIFKEILTREQRSKISEEAERRIIGEEPLPLDFAFNRHEEYKEKYYEYRQLAQEQLEKMIEFRIMLTGLIDRGCDEFGNAHFLKFISPLNKLIIPIKELEQIKKNHLL